MNTNSKINQQPPRCSLLGCWRLCANIDENTFHVGCCKYHSLIIKSRIDQTKCFALGCSNKRDYRKGNYSCGTPWCDLLLGRYCVSHIWPEDICAKYYGTKYIRPTVLNIDPKFLHIYNRTETNQRLYFETLQITLKQIYKGIICGYLIEEKAKGKIANAFAIWNIKILVSKFVVKRTRVEKEIYYSHTVGDVLHYRPATEYKINWYKQD